MHVPSTIGGTISGGAETLLFLQNPSLLAGASATTNIEGQDKDRTVTLGHHMGQCTIDFTVRTTVADGSIEFCIFHVERSHITPAIGTDPIPSGADISSQGLQQAMRLALPGRVEHFSVRAYSIENTMVHKLKFRPSKYKASQVKAGDFWALMVHNRGANIITYDMQARYKEYS